MNEKNNAPTYFNTAEYATQALRRAMSQAPTGRQMAIDGTFVVPVYTDNPANVLLQPANGTVVMWDDAGTLRLRGYTRATGWQTL